MVRLTPEFTECEPRYESDELDDSPIRPVDPEADPAWMRDAAWLDDLEYVWAARVRADVETLTARAKRYRAAAAALEGGRPVFVPGLRRKAITRAALRASVSDGRRIVVADGHGAMTATGRRVELLRSAEWCENRARAASMSRRDVVRACGGRWRKVACGCGTREVPVGCEQTQLCDGCRKRQWKRWRRRIVRAMGPHLRAATDAWVKRGKRGAKPGIYLITLTAPHSGDLGTDRKVMEAGWRSLSKAASYGGYTMYKGTDHERWSERKWWGHHALVWEATDGTDGSGHLHAHVAAISSWVPYDELHAEWRRAVPGALVLDVVSPDDAREKAKRYKRKSSESRENDVQSAAYYLAKYVTKGVEPALLPGKKAGELLAATRGRRKVTTSVGFWKPNNAPRACKVCNETHRLVGAPVGLQEHAPGAVLNAMLERSLWRPPRGSPQSSLALSEMRTLTRTRHTHE